MSNCDDCDRRIGCYLAKAAFAALEEYEKKYGPIKEKDVSQ